MLMMLAYVLIGFIAIEHIAFLVLEMFLWTHPIGLKIFGRTPEVAESSKVLAANQGLYNGFLAAGLIWGLISKDWSVNVFFVSCVLVAGLYGGYSVKKTILVVQALPALLALIMLLAA
jgi:putative membrane protein